jgi:hypothetical protein
MNSLQETHESGVNAEQCEAKRRGCRGFTGIAYNRATTSQVGKMVEEMKRGYFGIGAPSYETMLDTIDSASCRGVHSDWLLLEYVSGTMEEF